MCNIRITSGCVVVAMCRDVCPTPVVRTTLIDVSAATITDISLAIARCAATDAEIALADNNNRRQITTVTAVEEEPGVPTVTKPVGRTPRRTPVACVLSVAVTRGALPQLPPPNRPPPPLETRLRMAPGARQRPTTRTRVGAPTVGRVRRANGRPPARRPVTRSPSTCPRRTTMTTTMNRNGSSSTTKTALRRHSLAATKAGRRSEVTIRSRIVVRVLRRIRMRRRLAETTPAVDIYANVTIATCQDIWPASVRRNMLNRGPPVIIRENEYGAPYARNMGTKLVIVGTRRMIGTRRLMVQQQQQPQQQLRIVVEVMFKRKARRCRLEVVHLLRSGLREWIPITRTAPVAVRVEAVVIAVDSIIIVVVILLIRVWKITPPVLVLRHPLVVRFFVVTWPVGIVTKADMYREIVPNPGVVAFVDRLDIGAANVEKSSNSNKKRKKNAHRYRSHN
jgi:hypothetical protein